MAAIKSKNTKPEKVVRSLIYSLGYRFRLHRKDLPGSPDLVFMSRKKVIFVHGCFWHMHSRANCADSHLPKSNTTYWGPKLAKNTERDKLNQASLRRSGWDILVIWDCDLLNMKSLRTRIQRFLGET